jgi:hypothetical protein
LIPSALHLYLRLELVIRFSPPLKLWADKGTCKCWQYTMVCDH